VGEYGTILHTSDGGVTWSSQISNVVVRLTAVTAVDANNAWVVGYSLLGGPGVILHTGDAGNFWDYQLNNLGSPDHPP
jgi:photosystem II stability/assembly factor-like uncharacterized protein